MPLARGPAPVAPRPWFHGRVPAGLPDANDGQRSPGSPRSLNDEAQRRLGNCLQAGQPHADAIQVARRPMALLHPTMMPMTVSQCPCLHHPHTLPSPPLPRQIQPNDGRSVYPIRPSPTNQPPLSSQGIHTQVCICVGRRPMPQLLPLFSDGRQWWENCPNARAKEALTGLHGLSQHHFRPYLTHPGPSRSLQEQHD